MPNGNVLVVEDDDQIRRLLIQYLQERALEVDGARDGADALHQIAKRAYGVVILDVMMPFMSGVDFLDSLHVLLFDPALRQIERAPAVLVITGASEETIPTRELETRFSTVRGVIRKPLDVVALVERVETLLR
jgi:DNA-binding response OmpR family regulator